MQLIRLKITKDTRVLRDIPFKEGVNIITNTGEGNQIGKSTALRAINFCLGSDGKSLWKDPDRKVENAIVKNLITNENVTFSLELNLKGTPYLIQRTFIPIQQKNRTVLRIDSKINEKEIIGHQQFPQEIANIFGHYADKPSFNSLKNRFVRIDKTTINRLLRYLNIHTTNDQYLELYSYLFDYAGHANLSQELKLKKDIEGINERISALLNNHSEKHYKDILKSVDDELEILVSKEEAFDFKGAQTAAIRRLKKHRITIAKLSSNVSFLETKLLYSSRTLDNYRSKMADINVEQISAIYKEAKSLIPDLSKKLEETVDFHNSILSSKIEYVQKQASLLETELKDKMIKLDRFLDNEKPLIREIANETHFGGFMILGKEIQEKREERGRISFIIDEIDDERKRIEDIAKEITLLRNANEDYLTRLKKRIEVFNQESKALTRALFEIFGIYLDADFNNKGELEFSVINKGKISGDGAPRAAALAFDMAFVEYTKKTGAKLPEFTIQDYLEAADEDKLAKLAHLANEKEIQVIISVLSDKLHALDDEFKKKNIILELSKTNKFFKIH